MESEGAAVGAGRGDHEAQVGLAADGVIELLVGSDAVSGEAK